MSNSGTNDPARDFYEENVAPLFREQDVQCMRNPNFLTGLQGKKGPVLLLSYDYISNPAPSFAYKNGYANANNVLDHLTGTKQPQMPYGGPYWSDDSIALFKEWMSMLPPVTPP